MQEDMRINRGSDKFRLSVAGFNNIGLASLLVIKFKQYKDLGSEAFYRLMQATYAFKSLVRDH